MHGSDALSTVDGHPNLNQARWPYADKGAGPRRFVPYDRKPELSEK
jgi:hypothetical protein